MISKYCYYRYCLPWNTRIILFLKTIFTDDAIFKIALNYFLHTLYPSPFSCPDSTNFDTSTRWRAHRARSPARRMLAVEATAIAPGYNNTIVAFAAQLVSPGSTTKILPPLCKPAKVYDHALNICFMHLVIGFSVLVLSFMTFFRTDVTLLEVDRSSI